jgi:calcineurin-like phosphoesterase family protein
MKHRTDIDPAKTYVISDTHFGHETIKVNCFRPQDVESVMIEQWGRTVGPDDTILHLGDLSWRNNAFFKNIIAPHLTGHKLIVRGNHDKGRASFYMGSGFKCVSPFWIKYNNSRVEFSHYPWNPEKDGSDEIPENTWRIHGHIHNNGYERSRFVPYKRRHLNVSVEVLGYLPVRLDHLLEVI